jgi:hypothetical protein
MSRFAALALGFVLIASSDFELRVVGVPETICAKSAEVCETARAAIRAGWWNLGVRPDAATECRPAPGCFSPESDEIAGRRR